jgi:hypothetical protein
VIHIVKLFSKLKIGHTILAKFERSLSADGVVEFVSIFYKKWSLKDTTGIDKLSDVQKMQYELWKSLIQTYVETINSKPIEYLRNEQGLIT